MFTLHINLCKYNFVIVGETRFFILKISNNRQVLISDLCPHRSGPLHLSRRNLKKDCIVCPWHETNISVDYLIKNSVPAVHSGKILKAIINRHQNDSILLLSKTIFANQ